MKPYKFTIICLSLLCLFTNLYAQETNSAPENKTEVQQPAAETNSVSSDFEIVKDAGEEIKEDNHHPDLLLIVPVQKVVERGLVYVLRRSIKQAVNNAPATIILDMNTPGGRGDAMEDIIRMFMNLPENVKVYTYVNTDALSAGALISLSTDRIYMAPGARIGASAPVAGNGEDLGDTMKEKYISAILALATEAAKKRGHDTKVLECMVRAELEYKIGDKVICPEGQLLTLSSSQAEEMVGEEGKQKHLLSLGTYDTIDSLIKDLKLDDVKTVNFEITVYENMARLIEMFSPILMTLALIGIYIEFKTPGFGLPGLLGVTFLIIVFWGYHIAGLAGMGEVLFLIAGIVLLMLEIFVIPGFGIAGILGIFLIMTSLLMAMVEHFPGLPVYKLPLGQIETAAIVFGSSVILAFLSIIALTRYLPRTTAFDRIALPTAMKREEGYSASKDTSKLVGDKGVAITELRPSGIGEFKDQRLDVVSHGDFIDKGDPIVIVETHGNRIIVEKIEEVS